MGYDALSVHIANSRLNKFEHVHANTVDVSVNTFLPHTYTGVYTISSRDSPPLLMVLLKRRRRSENGFLRCPL